MLYLQKYLTNFQKLSFGWKMMKVAIVVKISSAQKFWVCNKRVTTFSNIQKMYKFQFFPLHCPGRNAMSSKLVNEFSKTFFSLKDDEGGYCGWKFQVHRYFGFPIETLPLSQPPQNVKISIYPLHGPNRNALSS